MIITQLLSPDSYTILSIVSGEFNHCRWHNDRQKLLHFFLKVITHKFQANCNETGAGGSSIVLETLEQCGIVQQFAVTVF